MTLEKAMMRNLSVSIESTLNFDKTLSQFRFQIHDTVRYFQLSSNIFVARLKKKCGMPRTESKPQRVAKMAPLTGRKSRRTLDFSSFSLQSPKQRLNAFFVDLNRNFRNLSEFWTSLVPSSCQSISADLHQEYCWNGASLIK
jgi:hypothetical protein